MSSPGSTGCQPVLGGSLPPRILLGRLPKSTGKLPVLPRHTRLSPELLFARLYNSAHELGRIDGLGQVPIEPCFQGTVAILQTTVRSKRDRRHVRSFGANQRAEFSNKLVTVGIWHGQI